jgi:hypothetical protein
VTVVIRKSVVSRQDVVEVLEDFLCGSNVGKLSWDGFTLGASLNDEVLEGIRLRCAALGEEFPPGTPDEYCNEQGREVIRGYIVRLRTSGSNRST